MKRRRMICFTVIFLLLSIPRNTEANDRNVISICLKDIGTPVENVMFEAYQVGIWDKNQPVIDNIFHVPVFPDKACSLDLTAKKISEMLTDKADRSGITDASGFLTFDGLKDGVYLIRMSGESSYGTISPFLIFLPCFENGTEIHSIEVEPKASPPEKSPQAIPFEKEPPTTLPKRVKTGDSTNIKPYILLVVLSLIGSTVLLQEKRGRKGVKS